MMNTYHFWKMIAIITPIIATLIIGFAGYKMYILKNKDENNKHQELLDSNDNVKNTILDKQAQEQLEKDSQYALIFQTEINHFLYKFRTCLHWTLPLGDSADKDIDLVFKYDNDLAKGFDLNKMSKSIIIKTFSEYNFREAMPNYIGEKGLKPSGYSNLLGILTYLEQQLGKHLSKYGSSISTELSTKTEYLQRTILSTISSIRIDKATNDKTSIQTIEIIADLLLLMTDDTDFMFQNYTKNIKGGYPIVIGTVTKSHESKGEMVVETQFSKY